jgi:hypothetical protein
MKIIQSKDIEGSKKCWGFILAILLCFSLSMEAAHMISTTHAQYHRSILLELAIGLCIVAAAWLSFSLLYRHRS